MPGDNNEGPAWSHHNLEWIKKNLEGRNLYLIAKETGLGYATVHGLARSSSKNPTIKTMIKIVKWIEQNPRTVGGQPDGRA